MSGPPTRGSNIPLCRSHSAGYESRIIGELSVILNVVDSLTLSSTPRTTVHSGHLGGILHVADLPFLENDRYITDYKD